MGFFYDLCLFYFQFFKDGHWLTPRGHLTCVLRGWVVSEPFHVVHSLRPPPFHCINCVVKESVWGFQAICSLNLFWMQISFPFVDIITVGNHALCCPDIRNWCPYWFLVHIFLALLFSLFNFSPIKVVT